MWLPRNKRSGETRWSQLAVKTSEWRESEGSIAANGSVVEETQ